VADAREAGLLLGPLLTVCARFPGVKPLEKKACAAGAWPSRVEAIGTHIAIGLARGKASIWEAALGTLYPDTPLMAPPPAGDHRDKSKPAPDEPKNPEKKPATPAPAVVEAK
jgi:hypothetical protein